MRGNGFNTLRFDAFSTRIGYWKIFYLVFLYSYWSLRVLLRTLHCGFSQLSLETGLNWFISTLIGYFTYLSCFFLYSHCGFSQLSLDIISSLRIFLFSHWIRRTASGFSLIGGFLLLIHLLCSHWRWLAKLVRWVTKSGTWAAISWRDGWLS